MMKKILSVLMVSLMLLVTLTGCGGGGDKPSDKPDDGVIRVWVGEESAEFYQKVCNQYVADHPDFGYKIEVKGMDTGAIAGTITNDPTAAADIYTVAHDNIGKLASTQCAKPITDESLIAQVTADNSAAFQSVIYSTLNGTKYLYGVPYISQALFLYYNKALVTEEQAASFEGLREAAKKANTKAFTVTGSDGFNMSFHLLATKAADHSTTVKIYSGAESVSGGKDRLLLQPVCERHHGSGPDDPEVFRGAGGNGNQLRGRAESARRDQVSWRNDLFLWLDDGTAEAPL